ncbi:MAG: putative bifunctional diguanylate cyclase/phosphodiesterase [Gaiellales bacterium]
MGLLGKFAIASAIPIVLLGLVLGQYLSHQIRDRNVASTVSGLELAMRLGITPHLNRRALGTTLPRRQVRELDRAVKDRAAGGGDIVRIQIWNRKVRVAYSDDRKLMGHGPVGPPSEELVEALHGHVASELLNGTEELTTERETQALLRRYGSLLEVYIPIRLPGSKRPAGAFEVYVPDKPVAAVIASDTRRLYIVLLIGLTLLYAVVFRIVASASRKLRTHARVLEEKRREADLAARHDPLTGLPNRVLLREEAHNAIVQSGRSQAHAALLLIDLDSFKEINDTLGHHTGDLLLREVGPRLRRVIGSAGTVARLGGDEFGILLPAVDGPEAAVGMARAALKALDQPFAMQGLTLDVEASIGIALCPLHCGTFEELMQRADVAMYVAKGRRTGYEVYEPSTDDTDAARLKLAGELRDAVDRRQLVLHYQPKVDLRSGSVVGAEALMRWHHPRHGLIMPDRFIPVAERSGLIRTITIFAIEAAVRECRRWMDAGLELTVSVNLSTRDLIDVQLPDDVHRLLEQWRVPATRLELEITESVIMADPMRARSVVARLREMGVQVAIDDFGSGYSSLGYLKRLPVNDLKIDKSFVLGMSEDEGDAVIVQSTIDLAHNLGLRVVAEGVETDIVWSRLEKMGCDVAQGYLISEPLPAAQFVQWLERSSGRDVEEPAA